ncbi:hypothetical protein HNP84_009044 [Thermocatellispora tengchongensis]|uniref:Uncharacterized protein n=1 Tax=Thermocatellispora tengchongensis TaxID=1073253 RepID=A0A840PNC0_9ACTN|nr:hypothetical protein [Thermocatellispora tengchongensis]MBB5139281.1 hypothetical protein [Thermocatellispora tengchongensis]
MTPNFIAAFILGAMLMPPAPAAASAPTEAAATVAAPFSANPPIPTWGPYCPEQGPPGGRYIRTVQPPFGLAYDLYLVTAPDGTQTYRRIHCRFP